MNTDKEELFFKKRLLESAQLAFQKGIPVYTDFLGLAEQNLFMESLRQFPAVTYSVYGGTKVQRGIVFVLMEHRWYPDSKKQNRNTRKFFLFPVFPLLRPDSNTANP